MRVLILVLVVLAVSLTFILFLQSRETFETLPSLDEEFQLKVGEKALVRELDLILTFIEVIEDSRCPINVYCIWSGRVTIKISLTGRDLGAETIILSMPESEKKELDGYILMLLKVEPPREHPDKLTIPQSSYEITLKISKKS